MILVIGTGRSGTSTTARLLHEELGVNMGSKFDDPPPKANPEGTYEDLEFRKLNIAFLSHQVNFDSYRSRLHSLVNSKEGVWGVKDPRISEVIGLYLQWFDPQIIWCYRPIDQVVESIHANYGTGRDKSRPRMEFRLKQLENGLKGRRKLKLDFSETRDELELIDEISEWLE